MICLIIVLIAYALIKCLRLSEKPHIDQKGIPKVLHGFVFLDGLQLYIDFKLPWKLPLSIYLINTYK